MFVPPPCVSLLWLIRSARMQPERWLLALLNVVRCGAAAAAAAGARTTAQASTPPKSHPQINPEITQGGPGCASMFGFLYLNGPCEREGGSSREIRSNRGREQRDAGATRAPARAAAARCSRARAPLLVPSPILFPLRHTPFHYSPRTRTHTHTHHPNKKTHSLPPARLLAGAQPRALESQVRHAVPRPTDRHGVQRHGCDL